MTEWGEDLKPAEDEVEAYLEHMIEYHEKCLAAIHGTDHPWMKGYHEGCKAASQQALDCYQRSQKR